jgi:hypothetical protein
LLKAPPFSSTIKIRESDLTARGGRKIWQTGESLQVGDLVDARDREKSWFESYITEKRPLIQSNNTPRRRSRIPDREKFDVKVHFMGWGSKWDDWISEKDIGTRIAPLNLKTKNWRADLFEGGLIEIKCNDDVVNQKWMWGRIMTLNFAEVRVEVLQQSYFEYRVGKLEALTFSKT